MDPLALNPKRGGPKGLKIAEVLVDDNDGGLRDASAGKQKLVIVGGGWGAGQSRLRGVRDCCNG